MTAVFCTNIKRDNKQINMFEFFNMMDNYEERKIARYEKDEITIDTAMVTDSDKDYETGIKHPNYNNGKWIITELYDTKEEAKEGHDKWVKIMTTDKLPDKLKDVSTCEFISFIKIFNDSDDWREYVSNQQIKQT